MQLSMSRFTNKLRTRSCHIYECNAESVILNESSGRSPVRAPVPRAGVPKSGTGRSCRNDST